MTDILSEPILVLKQNLNKTFEELFQFVSMFFNLS